MNVNMKDIGIVAKYDLLDSYRSRRASIWIVLFLASVVIAVSIFILVLKEVEIQVSQMTSVSSTEKPGTMTHKLWESDTFFRMVKSLVGDEKMARTLVNTPPLALFYGWFALTFFPLLVMLLSSENITAELASGSARYSLFRTSKLSWCAGKAIGQAIVLLLALVIGAVTGWIIGYFNLMSFQAGTTAWHLAIITLKTWSYSLAFLGLALGISQIFKSVALARSLGIVSFLMILFVSGFANRNSGEGWKRIYELIYILTPQAHKLNLWHYELGQASTAVLYCLSLGCLYFLAGYFVFLRKDA